MSMACQVTVLVRLAGLARLELAPRSGRISNVSPAAITVAFQDLAHQRVNSLTGAAGGTDQHHQAVQRDAPPIQHALGMG